MHYTLLSDGSSDRALMPVLEWALRQAGVGADLEGDWANLRSLRTLPTGLYSRLEAALEFYPCDLIFVHRDSEGQPPQRRIHEITAAINSLRQSGIEVPHVCVVPVRMQEAWLLFSEEAIRRAAGNPSGRVRLDLPRSHKIESLPDPKETLSELLRTASELNGRRLRRFSLPKARMRIAGQIDDFSPLRALPAFQSFEAELRQVVALHHWN